MVTLAGARDACRLRRRHRHHGVAQTASSGLAPPEGVPARRRYAPESTTHFRCWPLSESLSARLPHSVSCGGAGLRPAGGTPVHRCLVCVVVGFLGVAVALRPGIAALNPGHAAGGGVGSRLWSLSLCCCGAARATESDLALVSTLLVVSRRSRWRLRQSAADGAGRAGRSADRLLRGLFMLGGHLLLVRAFRWATPRWLRLSNTADRLGCLYGALFFAAPSNCTRSRRLVIVLSGWLVLK